MDIIEFFIYGIFFVILFLVFRNEFTSHFYKNNTCDSCKQDLCYPINPKEYKGYWGFRPYKGLLGHINPLWYYPYPYPTPTDYDSCSSKSNLK